MDTENNTENNSTTDNRAAKVAGLLASDTWRPDERTVAAVLDALDGRVTLQLESGALGTSVSLELELSFGHDDEYADLYRCVEARLQPNTLDSDGVVLEYGTWEMDTGEEYVSWSIEGILREVFTDAESDEEE